MAGTNTKYRNLIRVFRLFTNAEASLSVSEIAAQSGLSSATLSRLLNQLQELNLILEVGKEPIHTGRSKSLYSLNPRYSYTLSIFFDQRYLAVSVVDFMRNPIKTVRLPVNVDQEPEPLLDWICEQGKRLIQDMGPAAEKVRTVGVCVSGWVHTDGDRQYVTVGAIPKMKNFEMRSYIQAKIGLPTYLEKDTVAGVLSASFDPSMKDVKNFCFFRVTYEGIGFSVMVDGKVYRGKNGYLGETDYSLYHRLCNVQNLRERAFRLYKEEDGLLRKYINESGVRIESAEQIDMSILDRAARNGDQSVAFMLNESAFMWAEELETISRHLAPDVIVLGDNLNESTPYVNQLVQKALNHRLTHGMCMEIRPTKKSGFMECIANDFAVSRAYKEVEKELEMQFSS